MGNTTYFKVQGSSGVDTSRSIWLPHQKKAADPSAYTYNHNLSSSLPGSACKYLETSSGATHDVSVQTPWSHLLPPSGVPDPSAGVCWGCLWHQVVHPLLRCCPATFAEGQAVSGGEAESKCTVQKQ